MLRADRTRSIWQTPVMLMVSRPHRRLIEEGLAAGVDDVLCKPIAPRAVWGHVGRLVEVGRVKPADPVVQRSTLGSRGLTEKVAPAAVA